MTKEVKTPPTEAEMEAQKQALIEFYEKDIDLLEAQEKYYRLKSAIQHHKVTEIAMTVQLATLKSGPNEQPKKPQKDNDNSNSAK